MTAKTYSSKNNGRNKSNSKNNGVVAGRAPVIPPIPPHQQSWRGPRFANCAMDGAPVFLWLVVKNGQRLVRKQMRMPFCSGKLSLLTLRESLRYLDAFFFFAAVFFVAFFADFFV